MISILDQNFSELNFFIEQKNPSQIFILVDENTHDVCLPILLGNLETDIHYEIIELEAGEENKNIFTATQIWEILSEFNADRKSLLINLGGGVITDLGGFVATTYKRGIDFIHIPTSLLAMCDASIGGKTGIDHLCIKNLVGTFSQPEYIFLYTPFLKTLSFEQLRSGFAEMLKHGLISDENHWKDLISIEKLESETLAPYIERSMEIKQSFVERDFREKNIRKVLNFGHTIGHSIEGLFLEMEKPILHGEAVAIGMIVETYLSFLEILMDENLAKEIIKKINYFYPYIDIYQLPDEHILSLMKKDKKNEQGKINFSLLKDIGQPIYNIEVDEIKICEALSFYRNLKP